MRAIHIFAATAFSLFASTAHAVNASATQPSEAAVIASNGFAIDLYKHLQQTPGNLCISPYSVSSALAMTAAGAGGQTAQQMLSVLHWADAAGDLPAAASALNAQICNPEIDSKLKKDDASLTVANALFGQKGFAYHPAFLDLLERQYGAALQQVNFISDPTAACKQINDWASKQTHDRIKNALPASSISAQTRLVLLDAIYFKAAWENEFRKSATSDLPFFTIADHSVQAALMQQRQTCDYLENDSLQAVQLPYHGDFSLLLLLPRDRQGLAALEQSLRADLINQWLDHMPRQPVQIFLPKFKIDGQFNLNEPLSQMGMTDAFDPQTADFSAMTSAAKLCIDRVMHRTFIAVDETGTEAAAVTSVTMRMTAVLAPRHQQPAVFRADHPFLYLLRHRSTGTILFIGRVANPK